MLFGPGYGVIGHRADHFRPGDSTTGPALASTGPVPKLQCSENVTRAATIVPTAC